VNGTPYRLYYWGNRVRGRAAAYTVEIPVTGATVPTANRIIVDATVAGQSLPRQLFGDCAGCPALTANQTATFTWDGNDAYGRRVQGRQKMSVKITLEYDNGQYYRTTGFGEYTVQTTPPIGPPRPAAVVERYNISIGAWEALGEGLGGWSLSAHHAYDPTERGKRSSNRVADVRCVVAYISTPRWHARRERCGRVESHGGSAAA
jgi:hypothetical protein